MNSTVVEKALRATAFDLGHRRSSSEIVADSIRSMIAVGGIQPGERLPSERDLAALLGAARVTVREAIKNLNKEGLVVTTLGRSGGTTVLERGPGTSPGPAHTTSEYRKAIDELFDFRAAVEPLAASLAARNGTPEEQHSLQRIAQKSSDSHASFNALDSAYHTAIARMSHNGYIFDAVASSRKSSFISLYMLFVGVDVDIFPDFAQEHGLVTAAILARDERTAAEEMASHIERSKAQFLLVLRKATARVNSSIIARESGRAG